MLIDTHKIRQVKTPTFFLQPLLCAPAICRSDIFVDIPDTRHNDMHALPYGHLHRVKAHHVPAGGIAIQTELHIGIEMLGNIPVSLYKLSRLFFFGVVTLHS